MFRTSIIVVGLIFCLTGFTMAADPFLDQVSSFVEEVYTNYAREDFNAVYQVMHPSIQAVVDYQEYLDFQTEHFQSLRLRISEVEIGELQLKPRLSSTLKEVFQGGETDRLYGVELSYRAHFTSGVRLNQKVIKTVYVVVSEPSTPKETLYLLWDPNALEEELE